MKKWQLGICITCAVVLAGMFVFSSGAQAAGLTGARPLEAAVVRSFGTHEAGTANCLRQQPAMSNLLATVEAERSEQAARLVREAAAALRQHRVVIELPSVRALL